MIFLQKSTSVMLKTWRVSKPLIPSEAGPLWSGNRECTGVKYERLPWNILEVEITGHQSRNGSLGSQKRTSAWKEWTEGSNYLYLDTAHSPLLHTHKGGIVRESRERIPPLLTITLSLCQDIAEQHRRPPGCFFLEDVSILAQILFCQW